MRTVIFRLFLVLAAHFFVGAVGNDSFDDALKAGDQHRGQRHFAKALTQYELAYQHAKDNSQRGIALGKQAEVLSFDRADHKTGREKSESALALKGIGPFAKIISLRVKANCQMRADKDFEAASQTLNQCLILPNQEWAQPSVLLMLGDCQRQLRAYGVALKTYARVTGLKEATAPVKASAYLNAGLVYQYDLRRLELAKEQYKKAVAANPGLSAEVKKHLDPKKRKPGPRKSTERPIVLVHYMPWHTAKPVSKKWGYHWTMNHFDPDQIKDGKRQIASRYYPLIGPYDSADADVIEYHLLLMKLSGIDGVIVDWYGRENFRDYATLHRNTTLLLKQCEKLKLKFAICYEDQIVPALVAANRIAATERVSHVAKDIQWLNKFWFKSPSYVQLDGKPLLISFGHSGLSVKEWQQCFKKLNFPVAYFSQDIKRTDAIGGFGWPSPNEGLSQTERFLDQSQNWPHAIPVAFPRFADVYGAAKVKKSYPDIPDQKGHTFKYTLGAAIDAHSKLIQIATWNDWGEGTQIEPSQEFGYRDLERLQTHRKLFDKSFTPDSKSLRWPQTILQLRRNKKASPADSAKLNAIANAIRDEDWKTATTLMDKL